MCIMPKLNMNQHPKSMPESKCLIKEDWGYLINNTWYFIPKIKNRLNESICQYRPVLRYFDDSRIGSGSWTTLTHELLILDEVFEVSCRKSNKSKDDFEKRYDNVFAQIVSKLDSSKLQEQSIDEKCKPMNVILLSYDSVSRASWLNILSKTNKFIFETMKFELLNGYNIIGDGTPAALIPIYTGKTEAELPNVMKNDPNARYVDEAYPFIWKELHEKDYMTLHLEDKPKMSAFNYRMKGFSNQTCHHYFKHFQTKMDKDFKQFENSLANFCIGAKKRHRVLLDLMFQFKKVYKNLANNLAIMHFVENSHDRIERFNWNDNDLFKFLKTGFNEGLFENTAIFLFSDHGSRFVDKRASNNRYLEERLPFFSIYLPEEFKKNNPEKIANLKANTNLLTSPLDIHSTIRELTCMDAIEVDTIHSQRSISLFDKIPTDRNCEKIGISDHFCTCVQSWSEQIVFNSEMTEAVRFAVESINEIVKSTDDLCLKLTIKKILSIHALNKDENLLYKVQFLTIPNNGIYETMLVNTYNPDYEFKSNKFSIRSRHDISRIDSYEEQPHCVSNFEINRRGLLDIRKFCYCKL